MLFRSAPGLYAKEKKIVLPFVFGSSALFSGGALFGWRVAFPVTFGYFLDLVKESKDAGVNVSGLKPQWKRGSDRDEHQVLECRAEASGSLSSLSRFLYQVEKDPMAMKVDVVDLTTRDTEGRNLTLSLQVSGLVLTPKKNENLAKQP